MTINDDTISLVAAILLIPVVNKIVIQKAGDKYKGEGLEEVIDYYFKLRKLIKKGVDDFR